MRRLLPSSVPLLLASCCLGGPPPLPEFKDPVEPGTLLTLLRERQASVASLDAEGRGSLSGTKGGDGAFRWSCRAQGTARLRLTLSHRLKGLLVDAAVEGDLAECWDPEAKVLEKGPLSGIRVPGLLQTACLLRLLTGPADALACEKEGEAERLLLDMGGGRKWRLKLDLLHRVWESAELVEADGEVLARIAFPLDGYKMIGNLPWPMEAVVDQPGESWKLKLKFSEVKPGAALDEAAFKLAVPDDARVEERK